MRRHADPRRGRRRHDASTSTRRVARRRAGDLAGHLGRDRARCAAATPTRPRSTSREPIRRQLAEATSGGATSARTDERALTVPFKPGERRAGQPQRCEHPRRHQAGPVPTAEVHFAALGRGRLRTRRLPDRAALGVRRRRRDGALAVRAHVGAVEAAQARRRATRWTTSAPSTTTSRGRSSATSSARRSRRAGQAPLDDFLNETHEGYCQHYAGAMALLLRMGGIPARVATGFSPGGYSQAQGRLDRARHRRARVGRGVVRPVRLGRRSTRRRTRPRRARRSPRSRPPPGAGADAAGGRHRAATTPRPTPSGRALSVAPGAAGRHGDGTIAAAGATAAGSRLVGAGALGAARRAPRWCCAVLLFLRRPRGRTPMDRAITEVEDALRRVGRPVTDRHDAAPARAAGSARTRRRSAAYLRALARGPLRARAGAAAPTRRRRALRRALAQGLGLGGRLRALWALPPRLERAAGAATRARSTSQVRRARPERRTSREVHMAGELAVHRTRPRRTPSTVGVHSGGSAWRRARALGASASRSRRRA